MPRKRRIVVPGEINHVMARGLEGRDIFRDAEDYRFFTGILSRVLEEMSCRCYAWVLMSNHYHLVLRPLNGNLGRLMLRLNMKYARYFNRRYHRRGYLFQDRYKSIATQEYWYFRELIRYVHLNPLRAGKVKSVAGLEKYRWSGHRAIMGVEICPWQAVEQVLARFGSNRKKAIELYLDFLDENAAIKGVQTPYAAMVMRDGTADTQFLDDRIMGEASFIHSEIKRVEYETGEHARRIRNRPSLDTLAEMITKKLEVGVEDLFLKGRSNSRSEARSRFCSETRRRYGYSLSQIGAYLNITPGSVLRAIERGAS
jgi:putative transposase